MTGLATLLLPLVAVVASLIPAKHLPRRRTPYWALQAIGAALLLNLLLIPATMTGYGIILTIPAASFSIGSVVSAVAGRWPLPVAALASPWFLLPMFVDWWRTASPDLVQAYGRIPWFPILPITLICGLLGGTATWLICRKRESS